MRYKDYEATVEFDDEIGIFYGRVINTRDVITFYGRSMIESKLEFKNSIEDYLEFCRLRREEPELARV